jgi:photosystem II stability/assembly factor-like uncharacterized protein
MKRTLLFLLVILAFLLMAAVNITLNVMHHRESQLVADSSVSRDNTDPADWFYIMRSSPGAPFDYDAYRLALQQAANQADGKSGLPGTNTTWTLEGPTNINGRINCIRVHPQNNQVIFVGSASGGVFKTSNGGTTWTSFFDDYSYLAVGDIQIDPIHTNTMYVGTGDPNISGYPFIGAGIYKTTDGGANWNYSGLSNTFITSRICINPIHPDTLYAATMGLPFVRDNNRGLYKSTDGGQTWTQVLFISDQAGVIDLVMDPQHPDTLYAAGWDRIRNNQESVVYGTAAKIYKTVNGGQSWTILTTGLPSTPQSRIGLWMSKLNTQTVFASYVNTSLELEGIYKTTNGGQNWSTVNTSSLPAGIMGGFGWYFGQVRTNPTNDNDIFILGVDLWRTTDGGSTWNMAAPSWDQYIVHADKHDLQFLSSTSFLLSADGGLYKSIDNAANWTDADYTPSTQIYRVNYNPHEPGVYYGGAQDNGTLGGNHTQLNLWYRYLGGDGFQPLFDPIDPSLRYYETQNGSLYYDDSFSIEDFTTGIDPTDRRSWDMPIILSHFDPQRLYTGTYRVYRIPNAPYGSWTPLSPDLTDGIIYGDRYHVITTVEESPVNSNILYAGTSDANVWRSLDGGSNWTNVTGSLPGYYVTHICASPSNGGTVYVAHSGYKSNNYIPHLHKSTNNGSTWTDISGNLPDLAINNIEVIPGYNDDIICVATDGGVYTTIDAGVNWYRQGSQMPLVAVYDIVYDTLMHNLVAGTYGRAIQSYNLDSLFQYYNDITGSVEKELQMSQIELYPNPCNEKLCYFFDKNLTSPKKFTIFGLDGRQYAAECLVNDGQVSINVALLTKGVYILAVYDKDNKIRGKGKFIKL